MTRIIENGLTKEYEATCQSCGSRIAYTKDDVEKRLRYTAGRRGRETGILTTHSSIVCPVCQKCIWINLQHFKSEDKVNPCTQPSRESGFKWNIWELKHGRNPLKEEKWV